jgi:hypothetical protein
MIPVIYIDSRAIFFHFVGISRFTDLSHFKLFSVIFGKRPAGATFDTGDNGESLKCSRKLANLFDHIYFALLRRFLY